MAQQLLALGGLDPIQVEQYHTKREGDMCMEAEVKLNKDEDTD